MRTRVLAVTLVLLDISSLSCFKRFVVRCL
nr:MAG TPA: hypothetical protein [Caudoviricetes sp.]DAR78326.1 MAG TPA: hypothetical protein [Bacteriophage sp.]DAX24823.1 MAG TPA: hypothetical protein [Caudoviricetes sp.]